MTADTLVISPFFFLISISKFGYFSEISINRYTPLSVRMLSASAYGHEAGKPLNCLSIAVTLEKEQFTDEYGNRAYKVGCRIGGGIDQDPSKAPYKYPDMGIYITQVEANSPASKAGLHQHDKVLEVNGHDFTMLTHDKAVKYIKKYPVLNMLIARREIPSLKPSEFAPTHHIPVRDNPSNVALYNLLAQLNKNRPYGLKIFIVKQQNSLESWMKKFLVEDKHATGSGS